MRIDVVHGLQRGEKPAVLCQSRRRTSAISGVQGKSLTGLFDLVYLEGFIVISEALHGHRLDSTRY